MKNRLKELRNERNLSIRELSNTFKKAESTVRMWESGNANPDIPTLSALADYFEVPTDYLLGRSSMRIPNIDIQSAAKITGLSENAVITLIELKNQLGNDNIFTTLNLLIKHESPPPKYEDFDNYFDFESAHIDWSDNRTRVIGRIAKWLFSALNTDIVRSYNVLKKAVDGLSPHDNMEMRQSIESDKLLDEIFLKTVDLAIESFIAIERQGLDNGDNKRT